MRETLDQYFRKLSVATQMLVKFFVCNLILNIIFTLARSEPVLRHTVGFLAFSQGQDSWGPMFKALSYFHSNHEIRIYSQLFFKDGVKFQYPLTSLLPLEFLSQFTSQYQTQINILNFMSWIAVLITAIFAFKVFNLSLRSFSPHQTPENLKLDNIVKSLTFLSLCLMFYPLMKAYSLGQLQVFINCFFTISAWCWIKGKYHVSGILVGLMILMKPQYLLIAVWGISRKKYSFIVPLFIVFFSGLIYSVVLFGVFNNLEYLDVLKFISRVGESFYPNQSMNGLLHRLLFSGNNLLWESTTFPPFNPIVYGGTLISSGLLVLGALIHPKIKYRGSVVDFMIITLSCTIASPIAWEHHYGILLVIFAFLLPHLFLDFMFNRINLLLFTLSYTLSSNFLRILNLLANVPVVNIVQSYVFFSALIVLSFLYNLSDRKLRIDERPI
jgi:alpha-1,2-mannosyltransferase